MNIISNLCFYNLTISIEEKNQYGRGVMQNKWIRISKNNSKDLIAGIDRHSNPNVHDFTDFLDKNLSIISKHKMLWFYSR